MTYFERVQAGLEAPLQCEACGNDGSGCSVCAWQYVEQPQFEECGCEHTNGTVYFCLAHQPEDQGTTPVWADQGAEQEFGAPNDRDLAYDVLELAAKQSWWNPNGEFVDPFADE